MFYGYYNPMVMDTDFSYNIPIAYLFTAVFYFAFCLICIIIRSAQQPTLPDSISKLKIQPMYMFMCEFIKPRFN